MHRKKSESRICLYSLCYEIRKKMKRNGHIEQNMSLVATSCVWSENVWQLKWRQPTIWFQAIDRTIAQQSHNRTTIVQQPHNCTKVVSCPTRLSSSWRWRAQIALIEKNTNWELHRLRIAQIEKNTNWESHRLRKTLIEKSTDWESHRLRKTLIENHTDWEKH